MSGLPQARTGRVRALAVTSAKRSPVAPELPTMVESGVAGYEAGAWYAVLLPARTPPPIVARLHGELVEVLQLGRVR